MRISGSEKFPSVYGKVLVGDGNKSGSPEGRRRICDAKRVSNQSLGLLRGVRVLSSSLCVGCKVPGVEHGSGVAQFEAVHKLLKSC